MKSGDYVIEYCPYCDQEVVIRSYGITACLECGKPLAPCSVCEDVYCAAWPYGCTCDASDEFMAITNPPMTVEEINFAWMNCY